MAKNPVPLIIPCHRVLAPPAARSAASPRRAVRRRSSACWNWKASTSPNDPKIRLPSASEALAALISLEISLRGCAGQRVWIRRPPLRSLAPLPSRESAPVPLLGRGGNRSGVDLAALDTFPRGSERGYSNGPAGQSFLRSADARDPGRGHRDRVGRERLPALPRAVPRVRPCRPAGRRAGECPSAACSAWSHRSAPAGGDAP